MSVISEHDCDIGKFTVSLGENQSRIFTLVTPRGVVYRTNTYAFNLSFTNPLAHDEIGTIFEQAPSLKHVDESTVSAIIDYKRNMIRAMMKKVPTENSVISDLVECITNLESIIDQLTGS